MNPEQLTPREIVEHLDRYIVGQLEAKRSVAIALRNRWRRQNVAADLRHEIMPKNILMIGPTGVGKTEIARRLAKLAGAPFLKVEATKFTEIGYVGRDVESIVRDLVDVGVALVQQEHEARLEDRVRDIVERRIVEAIEAQKGVKRALDGSDAGRPTFVVGQDGSVHEDHGTGLHAQVRDGHLDDMWIEVELDENEAGPKVQAEVSAAFDFAPIFEQLIPKKKRRRRMKVKEARQAFMREESLRHLDMRRVVDEAIERVEEYGIVFIDELDKVAVRQNSHGPDVSREGVQRDLLPLVEGTTVSTRHGLVSTDHILFVAAGAFHVSTPADLLPELQGRFPIRVNLDPLTQDDFRRILTEPSNSLTRQYSALMATEGVTLQFESSAIEAIAEMAFQANENAENIGARRLQTVMEKLFEEISFSAPERDGEVIPVTDAFVRARLGDIVADRDLSRYIL
ncbi:ATP-dependent protease ATPase subunit HslU [Microvenator marinus]|uniref:ATP-dependent protease ATPase subunit HslU n=1 Tax=Microvenator marinus TaxID=2600177 RepID=A0A5B8XKX0_9DELT|nr:ATP-dependent protease ATPase subunit HslU [Microvenator marinus]QED25727.1 ATP-dependent protease ATPase subunit HslU [Microvenator marinus]